MDTLILVGQDGFEPPTHCDHQTVHRHRPQLLFQTELLPHIARLSGLPAREC